MAGNTLLSRFHVGFEIELPLIGKYRNWFFFLNKTALSHHPFQIQSTVDTCQFNIICPSKMSSKFIHSYYTYMKLLHTARRRPSSGSLWCNRSLIFLPCRTFVPKWSTLQYICFEKIYIHSLRANAFCFFFEVA